MRTAQDHHIRGGIGEGRDKPVEQGPRLPRCSALGLDRLGQTGTSLSHNAMVLGVIADQTLKTLAVQRSGLSPRHR